MEFGSTDTDLASVVLVVDTGSRLDTIVRIRATLVNEHATVVSADDYKRFFTQDPIPRFASVLIHEPVPEPLEEHSSAYWRAVQSGVERYGLNAGEFNEHLAYWKNKRPAGWMGNAWLDAFDEKIHDASQRIEQAYRTYE